MSALELFFEDLTFDKLIGGSELVSVIHNQRESALTLQIRPDDLISADVISETSNIIKSFLEVNNVTVYPKYSVELFDPDYIYDIIKLMRYKATVINGFLDDIEIFSDDENFEIVLKNGGLEILKQEKIDREIEKLAKGFFDKEIKVSFSGNVALDVGEYLKRQENEVKNTPVVIIGKAVHDKSSFELAAGTANFKRQGGRKYPEAFKPIETILKFKHEKFDEKAKLIFGGEIQEPPIEMASVVDDTMGIVFWGEVFDVQKKSIKQGQNVIININFTDYTSSHTIKIFTSAEKADSFDVISEGKAVLVSGNAAYDSYEKSLLIEPKSIMLIDSKKRIDDSPKKRVELHMHTNMSDMDAVTTAATLVKRAFEWGHRAVAVTDHGNIQAYPEAMNTYEKLMDSNPGADFKLIYGMEAYFVNDGQALAPGLGNYDLEDELVVFDVETTGFSPQDDRMTEIGAVKLRGLEIVDEFRSFIDPGRPVPHNITEITGITDEMLNGAPDEKTVLNRFCEFSGTCPLIAHNADFDTGFLRAAFLRAGMMYDYSAIDTVKICRAVIPNKKHSLDLMAKHFGISDFNHHRAADDARTLALIFKKLISELRKGRQLKYIGDLNAVLAGVDPKKERYYHQIILVKNKTGLKNLYKLVSLSNLNYFYKKPRIPMSELAALREGLIIGSACEQGELYRAIVDGKSEEALIKIAEFYDYLEIQPIANNEFMVRRGQVDSNFKLQVYNKKIVELGKKLDKPVVATCDVHFIDSQDKIFREILQFGQGYADASAQAPLYFRTTEEMLQEFSYLEPAVAEAVVITNPVATVEEVPR
ncbi:MAG: PHP domain-containing protein, partial [Eubacterium sp.]|nr:PHP domain-containing protein [Eubacterium sp.]